MKSTWFGDRRRYDFARLVHEADFHLRLYESFGIFLEMAFAAFHQASHKLRTGSLDDKQEADYMKAVGRLKHPKKMAEALGMLTESLEEKPHDFLGMVFQEMGLNDPAFRGQCFTPSELSRMIAEMTLQAEKPISGRTLRISEPACGAGAMVIAAAEVLKEKLFFPWHYCIWATDVDWKCFAMTYIQTTLLGIPCAVIHGNSLTAEIIRAEWNPIAALHPPRMHERPADDAIPLAEPPEIAVTSNKQLCLF